MPSAFDWTVFVMCGLIRGTSPLLLKLAVSDTVQVGSPRPDAASPRPVSATSGFVAAKRRSLSALSGAFYTHTRHHAWHAP